MPDARWRLRGAVLHRENIDTDQIIPARFLKTAPRGNLAAALFADWRYRGDGTADPAFPLADPRWHGAQALVAGDNFGCGSSREHAVWALRDHGFRAVVSSRFADIFQANALRNGLLPVRVPPPALARIMAVLQDRPDQPVEIDLERGEITVAAVTEGFPLDPFSRHCLLEDLDPLALLLAAVEPVAVVVEGLPAIDTHATVARSREGRS